MTKYNIDYRGMSYGQLERAVDILDRCRDQGRIFSAEQAIAYSKAASELAKRDACYSQAFQASEYSQRGR